ncbi:MAG: OmpA family protein [Saprospiraceae bacterium]|nr:OmpA family protein [Bacteroidia bacterium]NNE15831.1 OmpA family protein [Saprospiraceae bacterium]NNL91776.1 OmpA family protein [Saprospiraceae bacterium]
MNLLDILKDQVGGSLVSQASKFLGADESGISKAVDGIFPALLGQMINKTEEADGTQKIFDMASNMDKGILDNISGLFSGGAGNIAQLMNSGSGVLNLLLGNSTSGLIDKIAQFSGLKGSAASSLIKMAAPFLMAMVGKQIKEKALDVAGLGNLLDSQKSVVKDAMPGGLLSTLGGSFLGNMTSAASGLTNEASKAVGKVGDVAGNVAENVTEMAGETVKGAGSLLKWLIPAFLVLAALGYFFTRGGGDVTDTIGDMTEKVGDMTDKVAEGTKEMADKTMDAASDIGNLVSDAFGKIDEEAKKALSNIKFTAGSIGEQMTNFIDNGFKGDAKFQFNNLNFESGSSVISPDSRMEIDNLAAILKAYPALKIQITGYTDNTGSAETNMSLSDARSVSVKDRLVAQGISNDRIATEGKGPADPVASNDTEEGRAKNRRIEVTLLK